MKSIITITGCPYMVGMCCSVHTGILYIHKTTTTTTNIYTIYMYSVSPAFVVIRWVRLGLRPLSGSTRVVSSFPGRGDTFSVEVSV